MRTDSTAAHLSDRSHDRPTVAGGLSKPPVLRRATQQLLCILSLLAITFGTLGPLGHGHGPWLQTVDHWQLVLPLQPTDVNDLITNFIVYVPVGIAFRLLIRRRGRAGFPDLVLATLLSAALSYATEILQQAMPARSSSLTDVLINTTAAGFGCLIAVQFQHFLRWLHALAFVNMQRPCRPWLLMTLASSVATIILMTIPWNLTTPDIRIGFDDPFKLADIRRLTMFAVVAFFLTGTLLARGQFRTLAALHAFLLTGVFAAILEFSQAFIGAHVASVMQGLIALVGVALGVVIATLLCPRPAPPPPHTADRGPASCGMPLHALRRLAAIALVLAAGYAFTSELWEIDLADGFQSEPVVDWVPFRAQFMAPFTIALADMAEQVALYGFLTLLCLFLMQGQGRIPALLLVLSLVGGLELTKACLDHHGASTTGPLLALFAWAVTTRVWQAIYPRTSTQPAAVPQS